MSQPDHSADFKHHLRRCGVILLVLLCTTALMIVTSYSHIGHGWTLKTALILAIASVNAVLVAGFLMHLFSEKKLIHAVLAFTVIFFIGLMALTIWATGDMPAGSSSH